MAKTSKATNTASKSHAARSSIRPTASSKASTKHQVEAARSGWATDLVFDVREPKLAVSLRLDADVLRFFRGFGSGYQTRINEVLKAFMQARGGADNDAHLIPAARLPRASNGNGKRART